MNEIIAMIPVFLTIIGALAFAVSIIIEVVKNIKWLVMVPTDLVVIVLSIALSLLALFVYASMLSIVMVWYYIVGAILAGFFVAFIAMYGWDKFTSLYDRFKK